MEAHYRHSAPAPRCPAIIPQPVFSVVAGKLDCDERRCFEWFIRRTATKVPGVFASNFWHSLVPQVSSSEQVVLHAALALASAHETQMRRTSLPDCAAQETLEQDEFTTRQYNKAINHLLPLLHCTDKHSVRVALTACMVFACIEFLQRRYEIGHAHLQAGRKVLFQAGARANTSGDGIVLRAQPSDSVEDGLFEAFSRLDLQAALLNGMELQILTQNDRECHALPPKFQSVDQARRSLDTLLRRSYQLRRGDSNHKRNSGTFYHQFTMERRQIQIDLSSWLHAYESSHVALERGMPVRDAIGYRLLHIYYTMAYILTETSSNPPNESEVDHFTDHFISIINYTTDVLATSEPITRQDMKSKQCSPKFSFTMDMGIVPPLYFVATNCRVPNVRRQAIELLATASYQEGVWEGTLAAMVATEIMNVEERGVFGFVNDRETIAAEHSTLPTIPSAQRLYRVCVNLPNVGTGHLTLTGDRKRLDGSWETIARHYDPKQKVWND